MGGIWLALSHQFDTSAWFTIASNGGFINVANENVIVSQFMSGTDLTNYSIKWTDPSDSIIAAANELTLRTAISLSAFTNKERTLEGMNTTSAQPDVVFPNLTYVNHSMSQVVNATEISLVSIYRTDMSWLMGGVLVILAACLAVAPMYWGWWRLDREDLTFNPLEIANAFDAPSLRDTSTAVPVSDWSKNHLRMRIQYGVAGMEREPMSSRSDFELTSMPSLSRGYSREEDGYSLIGRRATLSGTFSEQRFDEQRVRHPDNKRTLKFRRID